MAVFSIFAYGSDQHGRGKDGLREPTKTFTTAFSDAYAGDKKAMHVIDGPGTLGLEVEDNTKNAVHAIIYWLEKQPEHGAHVINMSGFSRGSITCIRIANSLKKVEEILLKTPIAFKEPERTKRKRLLNQLQNIQLNMYLMDPVTGPLERRPKHARVIPDNVKNCVMTYQKDERRHDMTPQDMKRIIVASPEKTQVSMLPLYGNHSDTTRIKSEAMASGSILNWYSLYAFFTQHGTKFKENNKIPEMTHSEKYVDKNGVRNPKKPDYPLDENPSAADLLKFFGDHHKNRDAHRKSGLEIRLFDSTPIARYERSLNKDEKLYVKDPDIFVNQLERELFKIAYPRTFNYLFEGNIKDSRCESESKKEEVLKELEEKGLREKNKNLFNRLKKRGVSCENEVIGVGEPQGSKYLESCATAMQIFPDLVPAPFKDKNSEHSPEKLNKLPALEMEIYRRTFEYEREAFRGRSLKADWANQIREDTNRIISESNGDREQTYKKVLDNLEDHYKKLIKTNSNSRLNKVLEKILVDNDRNPVIKSSLSNDLLVEFIDHQYKLVLSALRFVSLIAGYERGYHLDTLGRWLENWGKRVEECLGPVGDNPLKFTAWILAKILENVGIAVKNGFGLKPISDMWLDFVEDRRVKALLKINETKIEIEDESAKSQKSDEISESEVELKTSETETIAKTQQYKNRFQSTVVPEKPETSDKENSSSINYGNGQ